MAPFFLSLQKSPLDFSSCPSALVRSFRVIAVAQPTSYAVYNIELALQILQLACTDTDIPTNGYAQCCLLPFFFVGFEALVCDFHRILPIQFLIVLVDVPILSALARNFSHPTTRRMDAGPQLRTTPKSTSLFKCFIIAPNIPRQSRHRTAVHNLKFWYLLFCFITSGRCSCLFLYQQEPHFLLGQNKSNL